MYFVQRLIPWFLVTILISILIWQWHAVAIMPDEIALRIQAGRYLQDHSTSFGLYPLCTDRIQNTPWIFTIPAWLLSMGDLLFSSAQLRLISIISLTSCLMIAAFYAATHRNRLAVLWLPAAVTSVAASTLVYFRFETFITFNLCFIALGMLCLRYKMSQALRICCATLLLLSLLFMAYTHPQAQLFIPLNAYITYRLLAGHTTRPMVIMIIVTLFSYIGYTSHTFFKLSCTSYPGIEAFWKQMVLDTSRAPSADIISYLASKLEIFTSAFLYKDSYKINYLPGLPADVLSTPTISVLNFIVQIVIGFIIAAGFVVAALLGWSFVRKYILKKTAPHPFPLDGAIVFGLIFFPAIFYFLYDANLYFYRSHFLNFLFVFSLVIGLAQCSGRFMHYLTLTIGMLVIALTVHTHGINELLFVPKLKEHEGPSTSLHNKWILNPHDIESFAASCGIDLTKGGGIISDYTYNIVKPYYRVYPITYLNLHISLTGMKAEEIFRILKPNYVLGRCGEMEPQGLGWPPDKRSDDLCCKNLAIPAAK